MRTINAKINQYGYQRNGVGGEGFYYFSIKWEEDGRKFDGIATLTIDGDQKGEHPEKFNGSCRVVTPNNLDQHWRGDMFECSIRSQHNKWYK